tara:strand:+ start:10222 stop:13671 length:3450 start_codon:yes stop_codon:yes gene_type:complete
MSKDTSRQERYGRLNDTQPGIDQYTQSSLPFMDRTATPYVIGRHDSYIEYEEVTAVSKSISIPGRQVLNITGTSQATDEYFVLTDSERTSQMFHVDKTSTTVDGTMVTQPATATLTIGGGTPANNSTFTIIDSNNISKEFIFKSAVDTVDGKLDGSKVIIGLDGASGNPAITERILNALQSAQAQGYINITSESPTTTTIKLTQGTNGISGNTTLNTSSVSGLTSTNFSKGYNKSAIIGLSGASTVADIASRFADAITSTNPIKISATSASSKVNLVQDVGGKLGNTTFSLSNITDVSAPTAAFENGENHKNIPYDTFRRTNRYETQAGNVVHQQRYFQSERKILSGSYNSDAYYDTIDKAASPTPKWGDELYPGAYVGIIVKRGASSGNPSGGQLKMVYFNESDINNWESKHRQFPFHPVYNPKGATDFYLIASKDYVDRAPDLANQPLGLLPLKSILSEPSLQTQNNDNLIVDRSSAELADIPEYFHDKFVIGRMAGTYPYCQPFLESQWYKDTNPIADIMKASNAGIDPAIIYPDWAGLSAWSTYHDHRVNITTAVNDGWVLQIPQQIEQEVHFPDINGPSAAPATNFVKKRFRNDSTKWSYGFHSLHRKDTVYKEEKEIYEDLGGRRSRVGDASLGEPDIVLFQGGFSTVEYMEAQEHYMSIPDEPWFDLYNTPTYDHNLAWQGITGPMSYVRDIITQNITFSPKQQHPLSAYTGIITKNPLGVPRPIRNYTTISERDLDSPRFLDHPLYLPFNVLGSEGDFGIHQNWNYHDTTPITSTFTGANISFTTDEIDPIGTDFQDQIGIGDIVLYENLGLGAIKNGSGTTVLVHGTSYKVKAVSSNGITLSALSGGAALDLASVTYINTPHRLTRQIRTGYSEVEAYLDEAEWIEPDTFANQEFLDRDTGAIVQLDNEMISALTTLKTAKITYYFSWNNPAGPSWYNSERNDLKYTWDGYPRSYNVRSDQELVLDLSDVSLDKPDAFRKYPLIIGHGSKTQILARPADEGITYSANGETYSPAIWTQKWLNNVTMADAKITIKNPQRDIYSVYFPNFNAQLAFKIIKVNAMDTFEKITRNNNVAFPYIDPVDGFEYRLQPSNQYNVNLHAAIKRCDLSSLPYDAVEQACGWIDEAGQQWDNYYYRDLLR